MTLSNAPPQYSYAPESDEYEFTVDFGKNIREGCIHSMSVMLYKPVDYLSPETNQNTGSAHPLDRLLTVRNYNPLHHAKDGTLRVRVPRKWATP
jgi:hypothetical protein